LRPAVRTVHVPVLLDAAVGALLAAPAGGRPGAVWVDATFGRGGHSSRLLERMRADASLFAFDRDPQAAAAAAPISDPRFHFEHARFSSLAATLAARGVGQVAGVLLDLGVSSPQLDDAARGFALRLNGPLDMRMDPGSGDSAADWLARADLDELTRVIRDYGEERFAASIAKAIVARRAAGRPLATTGDLAALVADAIPRQGRARRADGAQHPATRTFQAVRIHVNQELEELEVTLAQMPALLAPGGRLVAISFHSLEDRRVKQFIAQQAHPERQDDARLARLPLRHDQLPQPLFTAHGKVMADAAEAAANPRARSAVLRVAERTDAPLLPAGRA
jgi:16S rRNA (cytosine1402-N4)-methyltransferase